MSQKYTICEIAQNNGRNGKPVWMIVKGVVYDLTEFLNEHPGGEEVMMDYAGKDATKAFNEVGHSTDAIREMKIYKIGTVSNGCTQQLMSMIGASSNCNSADIATNPEQECCLKQKKRFKLFFCR